MATFAPVARNLEAEGYDTMLQNNPALAILPGVVENMQRMRGYENAGAQAAQISRQNPGTMARATVAQGQSQQQTVMSPGDSASAQNSPAQFGVQPAAQATPGFGAVAGVGAAGQAGKPRGTSMADAPAQSGMQFSDANETGFTIATPQTGNAVNNALSATLNRGIPGAGATQPQQQFRVSYGPGEFDPTTGKMNVDFTKFGGQKFNGTFSDLMKMPAQQQVKIFGNFTQAQQSGKAGVVEGAKAEAAGTPSNAPVPPQRPSKMGALPTQKPAAAPVAPAAPAAPAATPQGTTTPGSVTGGATTPQKTSAIDPMQQAMDAQQYVAELQHPQVLQALKMIGLA